MANQRQVLLNITTNFPLVNVLLCRSLARENLISDRHSETFPKQWHLTIDVRSWSGGMDRLLAKRRA
jgi:hypothetical protein